MDSINRQAFHDALRRFVPDEASSIIAVDPDVRRRLVNADTGVVRLKLRTSGSGSSPDDESLRRLADDILVVLNQNQFGDQSATRVEWVRPDETIAQVLARRKAESLKRKAEGLRAAEAARVAERDKARLRALDDVKERVGEDALNNIPPAVLSTLKTYQLETFVRWRAANYKLMVADEPGMGKTRTAVTCIAALGVGHGQTRLALVVCPLAALKAWREESELAGFVFRHITNQNVARDVAAHSIRANKDTNKRTVCVVTYGSAVKEDQVLFTLLRETQWDVAVADESHMLMETDTLRVGSLVGTTSSPGVLRLVPKLILTTGTPMRERPREMWVQFSLLINGFMSYEDYVTRFCDGKTAGGMIDSRGSSNEAELNSILKRVCVRRTKVDVLDLPPKKRTLTEIKLPLTEPEVKEWTDAFKELQVAKQKFAAAAAAPGPAYQTALHRLQHAKGQEWVKSGTAKMCRAARRSLLARVPANPSDKVIFFVQHLNVATWMQRVLTENGHHPVRIDGGTNPSERARIVSAIADPGNTSVRIGVFSLKACGVAATCSPGVTSVVFWEVPWLLGDVEQGEDRVHRMNTTREISIEFVCLSGSSDIEIAREYEETRLKKSEVLSFGPPPPSDAFYSREQEEVVTIVDSKSSRTVTELDLGTIKVGRGKAASIPAIDPAPLAVMPAALRRAQARPGPSSAAPAPALPPRTRLPHAPPVLGPLTTLGSRPAASPPRPAPALAAAAAAAAAAVASWQPPAWLGADARASAYGVRPLGQTIDLTGGSESESESE